MNYKLMKKHPIIWNLCLIIGIAVLGILIFYVSLALFTKHGSSKVVPSVENTSYSEAVELLHDEGFRVEIRDSLYLDDVKPGYVVEQFPKGNSVVKPGRKIFLYINSVHPKQVVIDEDNRPGELALKGVAYRHAMAHLEELGFKNIRTVYVCGVNKDNVVKIIANGIPVRKRQSVPINARISVEVNDGKLSLLYDSLLNIELGGSYRYNPEPTYDEPDTYVRSTPSVDPYEQPEPVSEDEEPETIL
jgi:hypothetical protein